MPPADDESHSLPHFTTLGLQIREEGYAVLELARPAKANAVSEAMWAELPRAFQHLDARGDVRAVVLAGQGRSFCNGIDLAALGAVARTLEDACPGRGRERLRRHILTWQDAITAIERCRWPVIAAVHGACVGAGVDIVTACDLRYAAACAVFCVKEVDLAIVADMGTLQRLPRLVGDGVARELALTARPLPAAEAASAGLVARVFPDRAALLAGACAAAAGLAAKSPLALAGTKRVLLRGRAQSVEEGLDYVATWNAAQLQSADLAEALAAHRARRPPAFAKL